MSPLIAMPVLYWLPGLAAQLDHLVAFGDLSFSFIIGSSLSLEMCPLVTGVRGSLCCTFAELIERSSVTALPDPPVGQPTSGLPDSPMYLACWLQALGTYQVFEAQIHSRIWCTVPLNIANPLDLHEDYDLYFFL